jgi:cell division protein FtsW (lipid II flippase)
MSEEFHSFQSVAETPHQIVYNPAMKNTMVFLLVCLGLLLAVGIAVVFLLDAVPPGAEHPVSGPSVPMHLASIAVGLALIVGVMRWPPSTMRAWTPAILTVAAILLTAQLWVGVDSAGLGWIAGVSPVAHAMEWAKLAVLLVIPAELHAKSTRPGSLADRIFPWLGLAAGIVVMVFCRRDFSNVLVLMLTAGVVLLQSGRYRWTAVGLFALPVCGILWHLMNYPYAMRRLLASFEQSSDMGRCLPLPRLALEQTGWLGMDLRESALVQTHHAEAANDFVAATLGAAFGWLGLGVALLLLVALAAACFQASRRARDEYDRLLGVGIATMISLQVLVHGGVVAGYLPLRSVALPFVSAEENGMVVFLVCMGIMLGIARRATPPDRMTSCSPTHGGDIGRGQPDCMPDKEDL